MGLFSIILLTGMVLTLTSGQMDCTPRLRTCMDVYSRSSYNQYEWEDFWNCVFNVNCTGDVKGQDFKKGILDSLSLTPIESTTSYDTGSMFSLSLFLGFVCLVLSLNR
ncbi:hypothetical protein RRG08_061994 [Elysia crispata]|uniref:Uncharacterized protein n=1 Tax=Elysia crispata TaxID=231223 RepID=A0AAE1DSU5_9GAST|nr:hypothetical protein RRG08_061994 [Elysia crispata]